MSTTDVFAIESISGTPLFSVDASGNVTAAGTMSTTGTDDFGTNGIKADVVAESTATAGVAVDGLRIKDAAVTPVAGGAAWADLSACATGEGDIIVGANLADAFTIRSSALTYLKLKTTTAAPGLDETWTLTAAEDAHSVTTTVNLASGAVAGVHSAIATATTVHTAGLISAFKASMTSLAGDTGGDYVALEIASTDGGGTTPFHSGIYTATPLDALIKVSADGMGAFVLGATMTVSPEATAESGYFRVNVGSTVYQVPIYAA